MNKSVITSVSPKECELIASGRQTMLVRKTRPKIETPFKCYIYQTKRKAGLKHFDQDSNKLNDFLILRKCGKVIGEFVCDRIINIKINGDDCGNYWHEWTDECDIEDMCLSYEEFEAYLCKNIGYGWHISDLKIYDKPKELGEFRKPCNHINDCCTCKEAEFQYDGDELRGLICKREISLTRPPQSWVYCEPIEEE